MLDKLRIIKTILGILALIAFISYTVYESINMILINQERKEINKILNRYNDDFSMK